CHRRKRLIGREHDCPALVGDRDRAERLLHRELKRRREIVERDEFLIADNLKRYRAAALTRQDRQRRTRRLAQEDRSQSEREENRGKAEEARAGTQWENLGEPRFSIVSESQSTIRLAAARPTMRKIRNNTRNSPARNLAIANDAPAIVVNPSSA